MSTPSALRGLVLMGVSIAILEIAVRISFTYTIPCGGELAFGIMMAGTLAVILTRRIRLGRGA